MLAAVHTCENAVMGMLECPVRAGDGGLFGTNMRIHPRLIELLGPHELVENPDKDPPRRLPERHETPTPEAYESVSFVIGDEGVLALVERYH